MSHGNRDLRSNRTVRTTASVSTDGAARPVNVSEEGPLARVFSSEDAARVAARTLSGNYLSEHAGRLYRALAVRADRTRLRKAWCRDPASGARSTAVLTREQDRAYQLRVLRNMWISSGRKHRRVGGFAREQGARDRA
jgi:hypothetical protein